MKRLFGLAFIALIAMGSFGVAHATPGDDCNDPVDAQCATYDENGDEYDCDVFINAGTPADMCLNVNDI